jgi:hypothetical protein
MKQVIVKPLGADVSNAGQLYALSQTNAPFLGFSFDF